MKELALFLEMQQLNINKQDLGVQSVHLVPEMGLFMVKFDMRGLGISPQYASFIDLDISKNLNLEMKLNTSKFLNMTVEEMQRLTFKELY